MTDEQEEQRGDDLGRRLVRALGPVAGGLLLDFADLVTFGPFGLWGGLVVGAGVGWWMSGMYALRMGARLGLAILAAVYCALPFTPLIPVATLLTATMRFLAEPPETTPEELEE